MLDARNETVACQSDGLRHRTCVRITLGCLPSFFRSTVLEGEVVVVDGEDFVFGALRRVSVAVKDKRMFKNTH